ncbi:MAG: hypothetical protein WCU88_10965 [Elusimicrobiota bacterium]
MKRPRVMGVGRSTDDSAYRGGLDMDIGFNAEQRMAVACGFLAV